MVFLVGIDPHVVEERCCDVIRLEAVADRPERLVVAGPQNLARLDAAARHQHEHRTGIVIASVAGGVDLRGPPKLAGDIDTCRRQQTLLGQTVQQRGQTLVERRQLLRLQADPVVLVSVPAAVVQRHEPDARFHEPRGQQAAHAEIGLAVLIGKTRRFLADVERLARSGRRDHRIRLLSEAIESVEQLAVPFGTLEGGVQIAEQVLALLDIGDSQAVLQ